jgi:hypothetical protein
VVTLKGKNAMKSLSTDLKCGKPGKLKECLHKPNISCIILLKRNTIQRQSKRADSKSGISPNSRIFCAVKVGNCKTLADCREGFSLQARENLLTLSADKHLLSFGKGL